MALSDVIAHDVANVFLETDDFAVTLSYTPAGGVLKSIPGIIEEQLEDNQNFMGAAALGYRVKYIQISALDNTNGHITPALLGVNRSPGDKVNLPGDAVDWFVRHIVSSDGYMHRLMIVDNPSAALR